MEKEKEKKEKEKLYIKKEIYIKKETIYFLVKHLVSSEKFSSTLQLRWF